MWIKKWLILFITAFLISNLYSEESAIIVTVDGLSFVNTLLPGIHIEESEHYLKTAIESMNLNLPDTTIVDFSWSRNANDTIEAVEQLQDFLKEKYQLAQKESKKLIIVAHSWGTVLSYLALSSQSKQVPGKEQINVDLYITLGSPLGTGNAHDNSKYPEEMIVINYTTSWINRYDFCDTCLPLVKKWINYWAWGDVISGPMQDFVPFSDYPQWHDIQIDLSSYVQGYPGRNTGTTVLWHKYDSLQPGGILDNQTLRDEIKNQLEEVTSTIDNPPIGSLDTPVNGSLVTSSIAVTGWALDESGVEHVKIYRGTIDNPIYVGDAVFVEGARPDVETAFPDYPDNSKAGWGYMMLTNFLPNGGNGVFTILAIATDTTGHQTKLGTKTITCDNANAVKPFGAIDTPTQGDAASGKYFINWGWALTPSPNCIPINGNTINVYVDGVNLGHPTYNINRQDIADLFPNYVNSNGAAGYFILDTTAYEDGVHTIQWTATDNAGNTDGIGSRYFSIDNSGESAGQTSIIDDFQSLTHIKPSLVPPGKLGPIKIEKGYQPNKKSQQVYPDNRGIITIEIKELQRLEINLGKNNWQGFLVVGNQLRDIPIGSYLDFKTGIFSWGPAPGFLGLYELIFIDKNKNLLRLINIKILPTGEGTI
jgi:hypothetical protein